MVEEDQLWLARGLASDEDVAWVRVAVYPAEEEHLCGEKVDHGCHYVFEGYAESAAVILAPPVSALRLGLGYLDISGSLW
jgi:hypothetical protein